ncbi:hypothetical protein GCM10010303_56000 [Streptomyces purpurascens]|nr:hypothetical protein GCM10010303_56000 [Streptomyces purpurascens]
MEPCAAAGVAVSAVRASERPPRAATLAATRRAGMRELLENGSGDRAGPEWAGIPWGDPKLAPENREIAC